MAPTLLCGVATVDVEVRTSSELVLDEEDHAMGNLNNHCTVAVYTDSL